MTKEQIFQRLWSDYTRQNIIAKRIYDAFTAEGETVENDHVAYRTFDHPKTNIEVIARPFKEAGYRESGSYVFAEKHLFAKHYEHSTDPLAPRVFISELKTGDFSQNLQNVVHSIVERIPQSLLASPELIFSGNVWGGLSYATYQHLRSESEYCAWLYLHGFRANHFTVSINALKKYNTIEKVNEFLKSKGFELNISGGEIKGTPEELLQQSSTVSEVVEICFSDGRHFVPACYYEFALRYPDADGKLYSGFIAKSADKIFESTDFRKA